MVKVFPPWEDNDGWIEAGAELLGKLESVYQEGVRNAEQEARYVPVGLSVWRLVVLVSGEQSVEGMLMVVSFRKRRRSWRFLRR